MKNPIEKGYLQAGESKLYYEKVGHSFPLVFIHGFATDCRCWQNAFEFFSRYFQVIRYDVRGFGKSTPALPHLGAEDLGKIFEYLKIDKAHLVGNSMGGNIALNFCQIYAEKVKKLVLVDSDIFGFKNYTPEYKQVSAEIFAVGAKNGILNAKALWAKNPLLKFSDENEGTKKLEQIFKEYSGIHFTNPRLMPYANPPTITRLKEIKAKTLVIVGENDIEDFQRMADLLCREISNSKKAVIKNAGHLPHIEQPEIFNELVADFLLNH